MAFLRVGQACIANRALRTLIGDQSPDDQLSHSEIAQDVINVR